MADNFYSKYPVQGGSGVTSLNTQTGALTLVAGSNISITPGSGTLTIASTGGGSGTVTSVNMTVPAFLAIAGNPITTAGTLALTLSGTALPVANGGTGATSFTAGSVIFSDGANLAQDNANFFWDNTDKRLEITGNLQITKTSTDEPAIGAYITVNNNTTVDGSNNAYALQTSTNVTVQSGATNDKAVGIVFSGTRGDTTDDGTLEEATGVTSIIQHNSGPSGVTNKAIGFDSAVITQQGTIDDIFHFRGQRVPAGGTATNHYGIYIADDTTTPVKNWLSGRTQMGGSSFSIATSAILDLQSTTGALLLPRMATADRDALTAVNGMMIYNTDTDTVESYQGGVWTSGGGGGGANQQLSNLSSTQINTDLFFAPQGGGTYQIRTTPNGDPSDSLSIGSGDDEDDASGDVTVSSGNSDSNQSGDVTVKSGDASNGPSGNINISNGASSSRGNTTISTNAFEVNADTTITLSAATDLTMAGEQTFLYSNDSMNIAPAQNGTGQLTIDTASNTIDGDITLTPGRHLILNPIQDVKITNETGRLIVPTTVTAGGTTGDQTIDKMSGTVNFAAAASSLTVTCAQCSATSIVFAAVRTNDTTAVIKNVVPGAGSFVIHLTTAATAETSVGFWVINT